MFFAHFSAIFALVERFFVDFVFICWSLRCKVKTFFLEKTNKLCCLFLLYCLNLRQNYTLFCFDMDKESISRRSFIRRSSASLAGIVAAGSLPVASKAGNSAAPYATQSFEASWKSNYMPPVPHRLSETVHRLADLGFSGALGRDLLAPDWDCPEISEQGIGPQTRYGRASLSCALHAPLRIQEGELLVGSASLLPAAQHIIPLLNTGSTSHTTLGFERILKMGYRGLRKEIEERKSRGGLDAEGEDLLDGMLLCLDAAALWNQRYIDELERRLPSAGKEDAARYKTIIASLKHVPENPPTSFREAIQMLWSMYAFQRLMGNWSGLGRVDRMLGGYLHEDLKKGVITLDEARELVAHFWAKGTEWIGIHGGSGDAQFYQNVILGGIDKDGHEVTNELTYLILDVVEELHISDYPIAVRLGDKTPSKLYRRVAEVQRFGGGIVSVYNENVVIEALTKFGYPLEEAREYTNDGCWECIIPGKTAFIYCPMDMVPHLTHALHTDSQEPLTDTSFEQVYARFRDNLAAQIKDAHAALDNSWKDPNSGCPLVSMFVEGCVEKGRSYYNRGPKYTVNGIHFGGLSDVANSLLVLKKLVFEEHYIALNDFAQVLRTNWDGQEGLRRLVQNRIVFYGNDHDEADSMMKRVFNDYTKLVGEVKEREGVRRPCGISTFGREIDWRMQRLALAEGSRNGDILATNCSPTPGSDRKGPTAALNSYCKLPFIQSPNGATLELKILPQSLQGENGIRALIGLAKTFREKGGFYMHIDVVDTATLVDAQMHPDRYPNLPVRVAGWSARFTTLCKEWQDMIIQRTQQLA